MNYWMICAIFTRDFAKYLIQKMSQNEPACVWARHVHMQRLYILHESIIDQISELMMEQEQRLFEAE